ncbi:hypothetical protein [Nocardioides sp.]|uniref:hypothetical protein n=1 Tax=Nocardioides sp. TaxID=35761 RepID=UPI0027269F13|nr:hypothetical protein [Nocardioides sp.]MDO9458098.1 hypothetical protein [Nocardioides sp.]
MTSLDHHTSTGDPVLLAAAARSVLACPAGVNLVVDGVDDVLGDLGDPDTGGAGELGMQDIEGVPTFSAPTGTRLVGAAALGRRALLTLESGLGRAASLERDAVLTLGGRLERRGEVSCECCNEVRETVVMVVDVVVLTLPQGFDQVRVSVDHFRSPDHVLNRGYLQRSTEHANLCHQDELRRAVSGTTGTRLAEVVGVSLTELAADGVEVQWVDLEGSHRRRLTFPRPATSTDELGDLLRSELHAGLC